jgi:hypothetical protein
LCGHVKREDGERNDITRDVDISDLVLEKVVLGVIDGGVLHSPAHGAVGTALDAAKRVIRGIGEGAMAFDAALNIGDVRGADEVEVGGPHACGIGDYGVRSGIIVFYVKQLSANTKDIEQIGTKAAIGIVVKTVLVHLEDGPMMYVELRERDVFAILVHDLCVEVAYSDIAIQPRKRSPAVKCVCHLS